jgi:hypothetical protein
MKLNADRLMRLSGITTRDEYTSTVLSESKGLNEMEVVLSDEDLEALGVDDTESVDVSMVTAEVVPAGEEPGEDPEVMASPEEDVGLEEAKLRNIIRNELLSVMKEVSAQKDSTSFSNARREKSLSSAMGFSGIGFGNNLTTNSATSRGAGGVRGFGGPGFMTTKK